MAIKKRNFVSELKDKAKGIRDKIKDAVVGGKPSSLRKECLFIIHKKANEDIYAMYPILKAIKDITIKFSTAYREAKLEKKHYRL